MLDKTMIFSLGEEKDDQIKAGLTIAISSAKSIATTYLKHW